MHRPIFTFLVNRVFVGDEVLLNELMMLMMHCLWNYSLGHLCVFKAPVLTDRSHRQVCLAEYTGLCERKWHWLLSYLNYRWSSLPMSL